MNFISKILLTVVISSSIVVSTGALAHRGDRHGNGAAIVGGAIIGGIIMNEIAKDRNNEWYGHRNNRRFKRIVRQCEREYDSRRRVKRCIRNRYINR